MMLKFWRKYRNSISPHRAVAHLSHKGEVKVILPNAPYPQQMRPNQLGQISTDWI